MPYYSESWEDPIFPKNLPPFDPSKHGTRLGANPNYLTGINNPDGTISFVPDLKKPSSWFPSDINTPSTKYDPAGKSILGDMYPNSYFSAETGTGRDFLHSPRFSGLSNDELASILQEWVNAGFTPRDAWELSVPNKGNDNYRIGPKISDDDFALGESGKKYLSNPKDADPNKFFDHGKFSDQDFFNFNHKGESLSAFIPREFSQKTIDWHNQWVQKEKEFLERYKSGLASKEEIKDFRLFQSFKAGGGLKQNSFSEIHSPFGDFAPYVKPDGSIEIDLSRILDGIGERKLKARNRQFGDEIPFGDINDIKILTAEEARARNAGNIKPNRNTVGPVRTRLQKAGNIAGGIVGAGMFADDIAHRTRVGVESGLSQPVAEAKATVEALINMGTGGFYDAGFSASKFSEMNKGERARKKEASIAANPNPEFGDYAAIFGNQSLDVGEGLLTAIGRGLINLPKNIGYLTGLDRLPPPQMPAGSEFYRQGRPAGY